LRTLLQRCKRCCHKLHLSLSTQPNTLPGARHPSDLGADARRGDAARARAGRRPRQGRRVRSAPEAPLAQSARRRGGGRRPRGRRRDRRRRCAWNRAAPLVGTRDDANKALSRSRPPAPL
jgi:hypothetical protein